jgi:hypothetical protein
VDTLRKTATLVALSMLPAAAYAGSDDVPLPALAPIVRQGLLPPSAVQRHVRLGMPRIRRCYERELGKHPGLAFRLQTRFTIEATGRVLDTPRFGVVGLRGRARAMSSLTTSSKRHQRVAARVGRCVGRALTKLNFPEVFDRRRDGSHTYGRSTPVRYGFRFKPIKRRRHTVAAHDSRLADELPPVPKSNKRWPTRQIQPVLTPPSVPPGPPAPPVTPTTTKASPSPAPAKPQQIKPKLKLQRGSDPIHGIPARAP